MRPILALNCLLDVLVKHLEDTCPSGDQEVGSSTPARAQLFKASLLNKLVKGHFVDHFSGFNIQYSDIFC